MASSFSIFTFLLLITVINTTITVTVTAVPDREYRSMLAALRLGGYHLFANAISTTDLHYDIINGNNFTFFAPIDSALYALDMTLSAADYTTVLRFHCVPHRLSLTNLRMLLYSVPSLVPGHEIRVVNPLTLRSPIMIEGVDIAVPGLFYGAHTAVHGLEGIMDFRSLKDTINSSTVEVTANYTQDVNPMSVHREAYAPSPDDNLAPVIANPDVSAAHLISVPVAQRYRRPEKKLESKSVSQPDTKSESVTQPEAESESISQPLTISESISHPLTKLESISQPLTYFESTTQPREEHISTSTRSESDFQKIPDVSLATRANGNALEEFTSAGAKIIDHCPVNDLALKSANVGQGGLYTGELYTPGNMICVQE
ncbi:uncharacterized protein LOC143610295 [Bidens hawaiensis]|uniref:uncharacterized protein LOC143610295 n=1 Tax=Bidens hawaiensis TaxID=980011 RepID=UPI0040493CA1